MSDNDKSYRKVDNFYKEKKQTSFGHSVAVPFLSGVIGAVLVVGTCFGVPQIRENLFKTEVATTTNTGTNSSSSTDTSNLNLVSLSNYEDTSIGVANKILPSIVCLLSLGFRRYPSYSSLQVGGISPSILSL